MILSITYKGEKTTDIGFLFYKNPKRAQVLSMPFGRVYVFYPEADYNETTIALLLDIDPVALSENSVNARGGEFHYYMNDKPYLSSVFMSMAISRVFTTAMTGKSDTYQELADSMLQLTAHITMLPCRMDNKMLDRIFEPLGYEVSYDTFLIDDSYPQWGRCEYVNLKLVGKLRLMELLNHIHMLMPVFGNAEEEWIKPEEADILLKQNKDWLEHHPEYKFIRGRYLKRSDSYINSNMRRLLERDGIINRDHLYGSNVTNVSDELLRFNRIRLTNILSALRACNAQSVLVLGCKEGELISSLVKERGIERILGADSSLSLLRTAGQRLKADNMSRFLGERVQFIQSSFLYRDSRYDGFEAACAVDVIEDMEPYRLKMFERVLFEFAKPKFIIITAVNKSYLHKYACSDKAARSIRNQIIWNRDVFRNWALETAQEHDYMVQFSEIGTDEDKIGAPAQMGVFTLCG